MHVILTFGGTATLQCYAFSDPCPTMAVGKTIAPAAPCCGVWHCMPHHQHLEYACVQRGGKSGEEAAQQAVDGMGKVVQFCVLKHACACPQPALSNLI